MNVTTATPLENLIDSRRVIICCGTGGVGKTTTAAVLAIEGARRGRRSIVVTIDPAKRLANTLGLAALSANGHVVERSLWDPDGVAQKGGSLAALMLDAKTTFDQLVTRYAGNDEQARRILDNRFYRNISGALSGTQEYMAMEKLYELNQSAEYDLIVVDTPPTRSALDFLEAPNRLTRLLDHRMFQMLMAPTRMSLRAAGFAVAAVMRSVGRVVGGEVIEDAISFFRAFEGMEEGFRNRAVEVRELLSASTTAFVLVTSPRRDAIEEATFFSDALAESDISVDALVINRVHPAFGGGDPTDLRRGASLLRGADTPDALLLAQLLEHLAELRQIAIEERQNIGEVQLGIPTGVVLTVPFLDGDVHEFAGLAEMGEALFRAS